MIMIADCLIAGEDFAFDESDMPLLRDRLYVEMKKHSEHHMNFNIVA